MTQKELLAIIEQAAHEKWTKLDLSYQGLRHLPLEITRLSHLQFLKLRRNRLRQLPPEISQLTNLQTLDLSANLLSQLPPEITRLTNLKSLNLNFNELKQVPPEITKLINLQTLDLSENELKELPADIIQLTNLQSFNLSTNEFSQLPSKFCQLTNLQSLNLSHNRLEQLPPEISELTNLRTLDLSFNRLKQLPPEIIQLTSLQSLILSANGISQLTPDIAHMTNLHTLDLSFNGLSQLPPEITQLTNLQSLILNYNHLDQLPPEITQLTNLQSLNLSVNQLSQLPPEIAYLPRLSELWIAHNPITEPSQEILDNALTRSEVSVNIAELRRYFDQLQEAGAATFYEAKLLIIGEGGAGKTSLSNKLQDPTLALSPEEESTEGIDIATWHFSLPSECEEEKYRVNIWDFGGQTVYFATHQFFLTKRSVYVLVTDTRQQHTDFYTWLRMQETFGGDSPVILLKNRNRRHGNRFTIENLPQLRQRFPNLKEVIELDLSKVPEEENWSQLIRELEHRFMSLDHVGKPRPRTWVEVRETLSQDNRDTLSRQAYLALCADHGIHRDADALQLSDYLHNLGDILHFQNDAILTDLVILQPTWGLDAVYRVLDNETIVENLGRFTLADLHSLWHEAKYTGHHHQLLRLMQNFQLCYPLQDQADTYIAPQLLGSEVPDYTWDYEDNLQLRYRYPDFMPRGILSRAIVKLHDRIEAQQLVWRSGVILSNGYARAEMLELRGDMEIRIRISGRNKRDLLMEIVHALDDLHRSFPKLRYQKRIPCNCETCQTRTNPHFYDLKKLLDRLANRKNSIECDKPPYDDVSIRDLLDDGRMDTFTRDFDLLNREAIVNIYGDYYDGDRINVGDIADSGGIAVGREAKASNG